MLHSPSLPTFSSGIIVWNSLFFRIPLPYVITLETIAVSFVEFISVFFSLFFLGCKRCPCCMIESITILHRESLWPRENYGDFQKRFLLSALPPITQPMKPILLATQSKDILNNTAPILVEASTVIPLVLYFIDQDLSSRTALSNPFEALLTVWNTCMSRCESFYLPVSPSILVITPLKLSSISSPDHYRQHPPDNLYEWAQVYTKSYRNRLRVSGRSDLEFETFKATSLHLSPSSPFVSSTSTFADPHRLSTEGSTSIVGSGTPRTNKRSLIEPPPFSSHPLSNFRRLFFSSNSHNLLPRDLFSHLSTLDSHRPDGPWDWVAASSIDGKGISRL